MSSLEQFNDEFGNSKYREIHPFYKIKDQSKEEIDKYQNSKAPLNSDVVKFDSIEKTKNRVGWIVPHNYVVIDVDNMQDSNVLFKILKHKDIKFSFNVSRKGGHFIFKNTKKLGKYGVKKMTAIGIPIDIRSEEKGYIILPHNDPDRKWGTISSNIDELPPFLVPLKNFKNDIDFFTMGNGDGRNDALHKYFLSLKDYANEISNSDKVEAIKIINNFILKEPLPEDELSKTVLRPEIVNKEQNKSKKKSVRDSLEELSNEILDDNIMITCNEQTYLYDGRYYKPLEDKEIERMIHELYDAKLFERDRKEVIKFIKLKTWVKTQNLNKHWNEIVVKNGILNISTLKLEQHTPSKYNTIYVDRNFIQDADYSNAIDKFFNMLSNHEDEKKRLLYEMIGYVFLRKNIFSKFFMCVGEGQTGKSTYLKMISTLIGEKNVSYLTIQDLETTFLPIQLFGKLANIGDDTSFKGLMDTSMLKKLVSGEKVIGQQKFKEPMAFNNFATLIFTTNKLPSTSDRTTGFYRRLEILEINNVIKKPDPFFLDRLTEKDYEYLLFKAIDAVRDAINRGELSKPASSMENLEKFRKSQSSVLTFLDYHEYTPKKLDYRVVTEVYAEYKQFANDEGYKPVRSSNFAREVCDEFRMIIKNTTLHGENQQRRFIK